jgi:pantoate--beta-alanine ligase
MAITVLHSIEQVRNHYRQTPVRPVLVPTMGALHAGHEALIRHAATLERPVVVSIFVNPLQFGPSEDFDRYPRTPEADLALAEAAGADVVWIPDSAEMTPPNLTVTVDPGPLGDALCGRFRPGHFRGVCTIVLKLFQVVQPSAAVFGWKDAQQFVILSRMVSDLNLPLEMIGVETQREPDGLARSSRNRYLSPEHRAEAALIGQTLLALQQEVAQAPHPPAVSELIQKVRTKLNQLSGAELVQYVECVSLDTLSPIVAVQPGNTLFAVAVKYPEARLIDNVRF